MADGPSMRCHGDCPVIRIAKLTDYAIVLLTYVARNRKLAVHTARDLATQSHLPLPTVSKVLQTLSRGGLLASHRGVAGGYSLAKSAEAIHVAEIVAIMEGPVALTECNTSCPEMCPIEGLCPVRKSWRKINAVVLRSLQSLTLADMTGPLDSRSVARRRPQGGRATLALFDER
jgi:FeS assembly SUF system regulator